MSKPNIKIIERRLIDTTNIQIHDRPFSRLSTGSSYYIYLDIEWSINKSFYHVWGTVVVMIEW